MKKFQTFTQNLFRLTSLVACFMLLNFTSSAQIPLAEYPLATDLNDALGYNSPMSNIGGTLANGELCFTGDYSNSWAITPNFDELDPNNIEFSLDFNLSAYSDNAVREGTVLMLGGSYRPLGIIVGRSGHIGFKYNNSFNVLSTTVVNLNEWYNARLKVLNGVITLYLDDVQVETLNVGTINYHPSFPNVDAYFLTRDQSAGTVPLPMCIKNVKIATNWEPPVIEPGAALRSNGGSQLVSVPDNPSLDLECEMTLEAWVNLSSPYIWGAILLKAAGNSWSNGYGIYARFNEIVFMPRGFGQQHFSGYNLPLNTWTHVACTYDGATSKIYINGNLVSTQSISGDIPQNNYQLGIGGDPGFTPFTFRGAIDEVRVWSQVLEQSDIQAAMDCEIQTTSDCLEANYHFNQGTAGQNNAGETTLIDASGNGNNGTLIGYALSGDFSNWVAPGGVTSGQACNTSFSCDPNFACCEGPEAICQSTTVYIQPNGYAVVTPADVDGGSSADCGLQSMTVYPNTFDCDDIGWQYLTLTITDIKGEYDQCGAWVYIDKGDALPSGWTHNNVGGATGDAGFDPCEEKFFVESNGYSHPLTDKIHYAYDYVCGNTEIIARVVSVDPHGFAGVMIRESLDAGSRKVALRTQLSNFVHRDVRTMPNGYQQTQQLFRPMHTWLKITRTGNMFMGYTSTNGSSWQFAFFTSVSMNSCVQIGLFAEGPIDNTITRACFDNVTINGGIQPNLVDNDGNEWETNTIRASEFKVFPNPATDIVNIDLSQFEEETFILQVFNNIGQVVYRKEFLYIEEYIEQLDISQFNSGMYMINIQLEDGTQLNKKLVVGNK